MKKKQKITRVKLQVEKINDFILLGLVSSEPDYKLSLALNKKLKISLRNISPVIIKGEKEQEQVFSRFSDTRESPERIFNLISNRSGKYFLIKKLRNIDYIFHIHDTENKNIVSEITAGLRDIDTITALFNIDIDSIKDKNLNLVIQ